jgi:hypothetical protein
MTRMPPQISPRSGLRIRGARGHPQVRGALIRFAAWLRREYEFPIRMPVYLQPTETLVTLHGEVCTASFFAPWDRCVDPYIRIATGDYPSLRRELGRDNALAAYIHSMCHELVHYWQWIDTSEIWERGVIRTADAMLRRYASAVRHP